MKRKKVGLWSVKEGMREKDEHSKSKKGNSLGVGRYREGMEAGAVPGDGGKAFFQVGFKGETSRLTPENPRLC